MSAIAISNNDMVYLHWDFAGKIPECLGFTVIRHCPADGTSKALPAMVGFPRDKTSGSRFSDTNVWPIQKYAWKDLYAKRGGTYWYEIVPMTGKPGALTPDTSRAMRTGSVTLSSHRGSCSVFFNRGIISTQAMTRALPRGKNGAPSAGALINAIEKPGNSIRQRLAGDLESGVLELIERALSRRGHCYCALYELTDEALVEHLEALGDRLHLVLSNADARTEDSRQRLHAKNLAVTDRQFNSGHIGHNKFVVYVERGRPIAVLCGSTNWTSNGLCAQSNNAVIIESPEVAQEYLGYWKRLTADTEAADGKPTALQGTEFRSSNQKPLPTHTLEADAGGKPGTINVWFAPNTKQKTVPRLKKAAPPTPPDLAEVFELIEDAKQGALFLAFIPGSPSIVTKLREVYVAKRNAGELFYLRGAATSPDPATMFRVDLYHRSDTSDGSVRAEEQGRASAKVASVAGTFAAFGAWEAELYKVGHAVIHDKVLVLDPFTDDSVVVTGSHNLGFRASYCNDENLVIIRRDRHVAEAFAAHVLDVYEHYRWRWKLQEPVRDEYERLRRSRPNADAGKLWGEAMKAGKSAVKKAWHNLDPTANWQDFYVKNRTFLAAEDNFWSSFGGIGLGTSRARDPARVGR